MRWTAIPLVLLLLTLLAAAPALARSKPILRSERALHGIRQLAAEACEGKCESWSIRDCQRHGPRAIGCGFLGRLPEGELCRARLSASLLLGLEGGSFFGLGASSSESGCPSRLFVPPGAPE